MTKREHLELQALAQIALPVVRRGRPLSAALPCKADRYRLRAAAERVTGAAFWAGSSRHGHARTAAVAYLARGGDPLPVSAERAAAVGEYLARWRAVMGGEPQRCCQGYAWDSGMRGRGGHHPVCVNYPASEPDTTTGAPQARGRS